MYPTKYHKPASISEAVAALSSGEDAILLAGGQTLIGTMKNLTHPKEQEEKAL